jgi:hypothetical protein
MSDNQKSWEKFLNPDSLRSNIKLISIFICFFEMFKDGMIDKPRMLFANIESFDVEQGKIVYEVSDGYKKEVLSKSKYLDEATLFWFKENEAIDDVDIEKYHKIRKYRNDLTHNMIEFLTLHDKEFDENTLNDLIDLYSKIEKWWFKYFELSVQPEILPDGTDPDEVIPGPMLTIRLMLEIALGAEPTEGFYYKEFMKVVGKK